MDVGPQFQQQQLAGLGGEQARPIARVENPAEGARSPSPGFTPGAKGEQLKMFMTPSEIHAGYQALDADRFETGRETYVPRGSDRSTFQGGSGYRRTTGGSYAGYTHFGSKYKTVEETETDEALYARKLDEAQGYGDEDEGGAKMVGASSRWSGETYHPATGSQSSWESEMRYTPSEKITLHESIGEEGVTHPIRLGTGGEVGSMGKPQVVGGHHRLASATEHAQWGGKGEQFVPVLHHESIHEARSQPTQRAYKYT